jgi:3-oxoacyl-[acyl-carrier-protein] synthase III
MTRSAILGVGSHVPSRVVTNHDLAEIMQTSDEWIVQRTGIHERRYVEHGGIGASDLAVPACRLALERAGVLASEIEAIIFATLSPDYCFPGSGCLLQTKLGLGDVAALDVRNQCAGFLYGLSVADAWIRSGTYQKVLLVGAEVHSTGLDFTDRGRDVAVLFGDGAGAAVIGRARDDDHGVLSVCLHADGSQAQELWIEAPASCQDPRLSHEMLDAGRHYPKMNGKQVFRWAVDKMPAAAREALERAGLGLGDVDLLVPHQANQRINELVASRLGIEPDRVVHNIAQYGNTTAATIPMALDRAFEERRLAPGTVVLMTTFGSGFVWAGSVARF